MKLKNLKEMKKYKFQHIIFIHRHSIKKPLKKLLMTWNNFKDNNLKYNTRNNFSNHKKINKIYSKKV